MQDFTNYERITLKVKIENDSSVIIDISQESHKQTNLISKLITLGCCQHVVMCTLPLRS